MKHERVVEQQQGGGWDERLRTFIGFLVVIDMVCLALWLGAHWVAALQMFEGVTLALGAIIGVWLYFLYHGSRHKKKMQELEHREYKARIHHQETITRLLSDAHARQVNYRTTTEGNLEVIHKFPPAKVTEVRQEAIQPQIEAPAIRQPTQRYLIDQLEENMLQVAPGVRADNGQSVILSIPDAVHFKLIGSSGFGKSCLAGAMLDQVVKTNSPDVLQIALLDLEHKTSRLFEHVPHVAVLSVGHRKVSMVATNADEVAAHLGYLKKELDRRAQLSEYDLRAEPLMLMYVEEMLSLQYEVDEALLSQMLKDLSILAVRARKYNMFLLACAQTDYSTPELKTAQKQFRSRMAFAIDTSAARAAGFMSTELIKYSFSHSQKGDGLYVLETPGVASLMLAPIYDVRAKVLALDTRSRGVQPQIVNASRTATERLVNGSVNGNERALQARIDEVQQLKTQNWGKQAIIEKVWNVKKGGSQKWKAAESEYEDIIQESEG